ncbi:unnamed protein product, partial [Prorocentrum cordatum]
MVQGIGVTEANPPILRALAQRGAAWNARGLDWNIGGGWNADGQSINIGDWAVGEAGTPDEVLQQLWDSVLQGFDYEIAGRHDKVGPGANRFVGHHGPPKVKWRQLRWDPPRKRLYHDTTVWAWATAARWATHLRAERDRAQRFCHRLNAVAAHASPHPRQLQKTASVFDGNLCFLSSIAGQDKVLANIDPCYSQSFLRGLDGPIAEDFDDMVDATVGRAEDLTAAARGASERAWRSWAQAAFNGGSKAAHAASKVRAQQELVAPEADAQPHILADRTMDG